MHESVYRAIADPHRRAILEALADGPLPVNRIAERFAITRPAISKHLAVLGRAGLVEQRRSGRENLYFLRRQGLDEVRDWLNELSRRRPGRPERIVEEDG